MDPGNPSWRKSVRFWSEAINKMALPIVTAIVALAGTVITSKINDANNLRTTINQREQAETSLRANMFKELVGPLLTPVGADQEDENRPRRLALLAELLALNFHEHFELGPLLTYVDGMPMQAPENRRRLRSVARRVIARQIAVLGQHPTAGEACKDPRVFNTDIDITLFSDSVDPAGGPQACNVFSKPGSNRVEFQCAASSSDKPRRLDDFLVSSPDCHNTFTMTLSELNWQQNTVRVLMTRSEPDIEVEGMPAARTAEISEFLEFTLTQYALPFSDNTLLRDGNRFGLYMRQIEPSRDPCTPPACDPIHRVMLLSLIWFPTDFIPPRERPTDFKRIRKSLNM